MAVAQSVFNTTFAKGVAGMRVNTEPENVISRTLESATSLLFGQPAFRGSDDQGVVIGSTFAATGVGTADARNTGTGVITASPAVVAGAKPGRYTAVLTATGATAPYLVYDPDGLVVGDGIVATANTTIPGFTTFTISNAGTMTAGDTYYIDVTYTANNKLMGIAVIDPSVPAVPASGSPDAFPQYYTTSIMNEGLVWVTAGASVADGDQAYWNPATSRFTNTATHIKLPGCFFDSTATDGNLVKLAIRKRI